MASTIRFDDNNPSQEGAINGLVSGTTYHSVAPERVVETPPHPISTIPFSRDRDFVHQGPILELVQQLFANAASRVALVGLGGAGKSQIAIEYAYLVRERQPDTSVFWVHAGTVARYEQSFRDIADATQLPGRHDPQSNIFQLVCNWLQSGKSGRWVIILDNLDDAGFLLDPTRRSSEDDEVDSLPLASYLPCCPHGSILITSRNKGMVLRLVEPDNIVTIGPMSQADAVSLIKKKLSVLDVESAGELALALDCIPLAIVQATSYISQRAPRYSVQQYLKLFSRSDKKKANLLDYEGGQLRRDREAKNSILLTWQISFEHIRMIRPSAADLISLMCFCDPQGIPESLLRRLGGRREEQNERDGRGSDDEDLSAEDGATSSDFDSSSCGDENFEDDIEVLRDYALVRVNNDGMTFEMHRLVQLATRIWLQTQEQTERWKQEFISCVCAELPTGEYENWARWQVLLPHARQAAMQRPINNEFSLEEWASVLYKTAWYLRETGRADEGQKMAEAAMNVRIELLGREDPESLSAVSMVGHIYSLQGRWNDAAELFVEVMETRKTKLGVDHPNTLTSMSNLASTYRNQGRWEEAENLELEVMETSKTKLGVDHPDTVKSMGNLASTYRNQGRWDEAENLELEVLDLFKVILGLHHPSTLSSMADLASTYLHQGRWNEAEALQVDVLEMSKEKLGPEHPSTLSSMDNLGLTYGNQGRWEAAEELQVEVLEMSKTKLGVDHPDTLTSMDNLASTYRNQGRLEEAEELQVQVLETRKTKLGVDHPETLTSMDNLASTYRNQGRLEKAEELQVQVLETRKTKLGPQHPSTLSSMNNLALLLCSLGKYEEAEQMHRETLELSKSVLGLIHPSTLDRMDNLVLVLRIIGKDDEVEQICREKLELRGIKSVNDDSSSDVSDVPSVFSSTTQLTAMTFESLRASESSAEHFADLLSGMESLQPLYSQALTILGSLRFAKNHNRLLKKLFNDLRSHAEDSLSLQTVRYLGTRPQRERITSILCGIFQANQDQASHLTATRIRDQRGDRKLLLNRFLGQVAERNKIELNESVGGQKNTNTNASTTTKGNDNHFNEDNETEVDVNENKRGTIDLTRSHQAIEDSDEEDEASDSDDSHTSDCQRPENRLEYLEIVDTFLTEGSAFEIFRASFNAIVNPPTSMEAALKTGNAKVVQRLLATHFDRIALGEFQWLQELKDIGYTFVEMADLLLEQASDSPWIYFSSHDIEVVGMQNGTHLTGCVHEIFCSPIDNSQILNISPSPSADYHETVLTVQELCGLAGIIPLSRDKESWNGVVEFSNENTTALISYRPTTKNFASTMSLLTFILDGLCAAVGFFQSRGFCCNLFTVLQCLHCNLGQTSQHASTIELCHIDFACLTEFRETMKQASDASSLDAQALALQILSTVFQLEGDEMQSLENLEIDMLLSLTVQFLCLGFLSYSQAHVGAIQLFFLDIPISQVQLSGISTSSSYPRIEGRLMELTCMGDMVREPVFTFSLIFPQQELKSEDFMRKFDLLTNLEDLVDTWGPGQFIVPKKELPLPVALLIGGGIIHATDPACTQFHWSQDLDSDVLSNQEIDPSIKIVIGTSVYINTKCQIDEEQCWRKSSEYLHSLGSYGSHWELAERQIGIQAGEYVLLQANAAQKKVAGRTLKQYRLQQEDEALVAFLDNLWGLQVSFCTGISRRVPLRDMVADMFPVFAEALISGGEDRVVWEELQGRYVIIDQFRLGMARDCLLRLPAKLHRLALKIIRRIFTALADTGVDRSGKYMVVAWPRPHDPYRCLQVPCEQESFWTKVLTDSEDCATFAYITTLCLETDTIRCQGPEPTWKNIMPLMETAVIQSVNSSVRVAIGANAVPKASSASTPILSRTGPTTSALLKPCISLQHNATHFFQKIDECFFVTVQRPNAAVTATLVARSSSLPLRIRLRFLQREEQKRKARLRERVANEDIAELVSLYAPAP